MATTIELHYDEDRENHVDEQGRTVADLMEDYPDLEHVEPPHYDMPRARPDGTHLFMRETVVVEGVDGYPDVEQEGVDEPQTVESDGDGDGYNYSYNEEEDQYECGDCDFTTDSTDSTRGIKGHWTQAHGGE